ncbi:MAG: hypothetical protein Q4C42_03220 [Clostridia bacterium]|nr:hypothetical protein [Clostridia bacterium]
MKFDLVKKILASVAACAMIASMTACSSKDTAVIGGADGPTEIVITDEESSADAVAENSAEESTEVSAEDTVDPDDISNYIPKPQAGDDDFYALFKTNDIDADYLETSKTATAAVAGIRAGNECAERWMAQVQISLDELDTLDASVAEEQRKSQENWEKTLDKKRDAAKENLTTQGSVQNIEMAFNVMLLYRERAAEVLYEVYKLNGEVNVTAGTGEAVG